MERRKYIFITLRDLKFVGSCNLKCGCCVYTLKIKRFDEIFRFKNLNGVMKGTRFLPFAAIVELIFYHVNKWFVKKRKIVGQ